MLGALSLSLPVVTMQPTGTMQRKLAGPGHGPWGVVGAVRRPTSSWMCRNL